MPVHDWSRVDAGIFHDFHTVWIGTIRTALNEELLPEGYYALAEQHAGRASAEVLTLHASPTPREPWPLPPATGGTVVAEGPPQVRRKLTVEQAALTRRRTLAIRHVSGHRLVALLEIVSLANKDRAQTVAEFAAKAVSGLDAGVHLLLVDLIAPGAIPAAGTLRQCFAGADVPGCLSRHARVREILPFSSGKGGRDCRPSRASPSLASLSRG